MKTTVLVLSSIWMISMLGCGRTVHRVDDAAIAVTVTAEAQPVERRTSVYRHEHELHCCVSMAGIGDTVLLRAVWIADTPIAGRSVLDTSQIRIHGDGWVDFALFLGADGLPYGDYRVRILDDDATLHEQTFSVSPMYGGALAEAVISAKLTPSGLPESADSVFRTGEPVFLAMYAVLDSKLDLSLRRRSTGDEQHAETAVSAAGWNTLDLQEEFTLTPDDYTLVLSVPEGTPLTMGLRITPP